MRFLFILILFLTSPVWGQKSTVFFHIDKITVKERLVKDSTNFDRYEKKALETFALNGYTGISFKDSVVKNSGTHYYYEAEHQFKKIALETTNRKAKVSSSNSKDYVAALKELEAEITNLENNGFPFAQVVFTEQIEEGDVLKLKYKIDSGEYFIIDKIHLKTEDKFHEKTVLNLIGMKVGEKYNEEKISQLGTLLSASKMYTLSRPAEVLFRKGRAELFIYFSKQKSSSADGYVGFQQDQITNRLVLNGYINLQLNNAINRAEILDLNWKSNPDKTQNLKSRIAYPFLFNTPLGVGASLDLRKQDSTFLRTDITFNLSYYHPYFRFTLFNQLESSITLRESAPDEYRNYRKNTLGASAEFAAPTFQAIPWYHPQLYLMGGFYNYRDDTIDDNKQKIANSKYAIRYEHSIDFARYFHLNNTIQFQGLTSNIALSRNELIYFGGLRSVRGFYELELSGKDIWSFLNEIEFRPVNLISIFLLYDRSSYQNDGHHFTNSFGFGFGLNGQGSALEIIVANGVLDNNPFDLANIKIHIGFKSSF